jgi:hypothetical protein
MLYQVKPVRLINRPGDVVHPRGITMKRLESLREPFLLVYTTLSMERLENIVHGFLVVNALLNKASRLGNLANAAFTLSLACS